ncbi:MAG: hypothetical protein MUF49_20380 [Oculatellaceae cyanobacterium Prado106]|nr:hypothetical protein [Oculatellaceae cyanobacterium Prado106]
MNPTPSSPTPVNAESSAVQSYLNLLQGVITRMAGNSSNCKSLCITLVSAIAVFIADKGQPHYIVITIIPILLFSLLDAYYLGLEQGFRETYNDFVNRLHHNKAYSTDLFRILPQGRDKDKGLTRFDPVVATRKAYKSFSVYPFYLVLFVVLGVGWYFILASQPK